MTAKLSYLVGIETAGYMPISSDICPHTTICHTSWSFCTCVYMLLICDTGHIWYLVSVQLISFSPWDTYLLPWCRDCCISVTTSKYQNQYSHDHVPCIKFYSSPGWAAQKRIIKHFDANRHSNMPSAYAAQSNCSGRIGRVTYPNESCLSFKSCTILCKLTNSMHDLLRHSKHLHEVCA